MEEVLAIHRDLLDRDGGTPGILNLGSVDSALDRTKWGPYDGRPSLVGRAALLLRGICQDHPFADGNKRTSFFASYTFLARNGLLLTASDEQVIAFMLDVAQDRINLVAMAEWLHAHGKTINQEE